MRAPRAGSTGAPELQLAVSCRMAGTAAGPPAPSSLADSDAGGCAHLAAALIAHCRLTSAPTRSAADDFDADEEMDMYTRGATAPPDSHNMRCASFPSLACLLV